MTKLRADERWAALMIQTALGVPVETWDDGSRPGMHDLNVVRPAGTLEAVEVTSATDGTSAALWKLLNGDDERWQVTGLRGGWLVEVAPTARGKRLKAELPDLLAAIEADGPTTTLCADIARLGVRYCSQSETSFPGSIYVTIAEPLERTGGAVPITGDPLAHWIGTFLGAPAQADVVAKLQRAGTKRTHAVVVVRGFAPVRFAVADLLLRDDAPLPTLAPSLPGGVSDVWTASTWTSGVGFRWSAGEGWRRFDKLLSAPPHFAQVS